MSELGTLLLENLSPRHEVGLSDLFCALSANGAGNFFYPHPLTPEEARRLCRYSGLDQYFVATINGRILGYGMLRGWDEGYAIPSLGLATHPDARSQGLGEFLMRELIQQARNRGAPQLRLNADASRLRLINFLVRHGFVFSPFKPGRLLGMLDLQRPQ
jgi:ribosomal protein S18 acetylase RimI-like enzyme